MLYIEATSTIITSPGEQYIHPVTGIVYGGTDYDNPVKLAEIGAVPLRVEQPTEGFDAATWEIVDDVAHPGDKLKRPLTTTSWIITVTDRTVKNTLVDLERTRRLNQLTVTTSGVTFEADPSSRINLTTVIAAIAGGAVVPNPFPWRDAGNVVRNLTHVQLLELSRLMLIAVRDVFQKSWTLKDTTLPAITDAIAFRAFDVTDNSLWA
jgi:hypothetical protein